MAKEKVKERNIWQRIGLLDYRIIYTLVLILVAIPIWSPIGIPLRVGQNVKDYADALYALEPGSVVLCKFSGYATMLPDVEPIYMATWKILLSRPVKFLVLIQHPDSPSIIQYEFERLKPYIDEYGKEYGVDYMFFPYISMTEAAEISFTENIRDIFTEDLFGTPLDELPIMENIHSAHDFDLVISMSPEYDTRRYYVPYGIPLICWGTGTGLLPFVPPYYGYSVLGYCGGASQGGELELYSGFLGEGVKYNDAKNLAIIGLMVFIVVGNIAYFGEKLSKGGEK